MAFFPRPTHPSRIHRWFNSLATKGGGGGAKAQQAPRA
jgi:hypothetical protein